MEEGPGQPFEAQMTEYPNFPGELQRGAPDKRGCKGMETMPNLKTPEMKIETLAVHAGRRSDPATGAVTPPIHLSPLSNAALTASIPLDSVTHGKEIRTGGRSRNA